MCRVIGARKLPWAGALSELKVVCEAEPKAIMIWGCALAKRDRPTYWLLSFGVGLCRTIFCILSPGCQSISQLTTWICPQGQVITQVGNTFVSLSQSPTKIPPEIVSYIRIHMPTTTTSFIKSDLFWHFITFRIIVEYLGIADARPAILTDVLPNLKLWLCMYLLTSYMCGGAGSFLSDLPVNKERNINLIFFGATILF